MFAAPYDVTVPAWQVRAGTAFLNNARERSRIEIGLFHGISDE